MSCDVQINGGNIWWALWAGPGLIRTPRLFMNAYLTSDMSSCHFIHESGVKMTQVCPKCPEDRRPPPTGTVISSHAGAMKNEDTGFLCGAFKCNQNTGDMGGRNSRRCWFWEAGSSGLCVTPTQEPTGCDCCSPASYQLLDDIRDWGIVKQL